jgi:hypothetical protein
MHFLRFLYFLAFLRVAIAQQIWDIVGSFSLIKVLADALIVANNMGPFQPIYPLASVFAN